MNFVRYIVRYKATDEWLATMHAPPGWSDEEYRIGLHRLYDGAYHCIGLPNDPKDINAALLMSEKALKKWERDNRRGSIIPYDIITVNCSI